MAARSDTPTPRALPEEPVFVVLDGVDGCGKTTQAARLVATLAAAGRRAVHLREPGSTPAGERIRELVLDPDLRLGRGTLALLFAAARRETLEQIVAPSLADGADVVIERFHASTFAYQGGGPRPDEVGTFDDQALIELLHGWAGSPRPTVEVVLDLAPKDAFARAMAREGGGVDRFEARGLGYQESVAAAMRAYVERVPRAVLVPASGPEDDVAARVALAVVGAALQRA